MLLTDMKNEFEDYDLIERYVLNELNAADKAAVELRMQSDPSFATEVEAHRAVTELIIDQGLIQLKQKIAKVRTEFTTQAIPKNSLLKNWKFWGAAGLLGLGITLSYFLLPSATEEKVYVSPFPDFKASKVENTSENLSVNSTEGADLKVDEKVNLNLPKDKSLEKRTTFEVNLLNSNVEIENPPFNVFGNNFKKEEFEDSNLKENTSEETSNKVVSNPTDNEEDSNSGTDPNPSPVDHCANVDLLEDNTKVQAAYNNKKTGSIMVEATFTGMQGILKYSINNGKSFAASPVFSNLEPGTYTVWVRDENNCTKEVGSYTVQNNVIKPNRVSISHGSPVELAVPEFVKGSYKILIMTELGKEVQNFNCDDDTKCVWDAKTKEGYAPKGNYRYYLVQGSGVVEFLGQITIK